MERNQIEQSQLYCCWRIQAEKRFERGEILSKSLDRCLRECRGYDSDCRDYKPLQGEIK